MASRAVEKRKGVKVVEVRAMFAGGFEDGGEGGAMRGMYRVRTTVA